ncbi:ceramide kinase-like protein isoform X2 [Acanthaster planci]|uniref:Ceramide kinase-like protein isoform X2 n=1 Tax=Acanthaster planci TaxID=133434 RepID=A0A8B7Y312_ACAPL|nr:ceramide kinase-like protein isoform X2 [Acanthaster planci]
MAKSAWTDDLAVASPAPVDFRGAHIKLTNSEEETTPPTLPLRGIFDIKSKHYDVVLEKDRISWSLILPTMQSGRRRSIHASVSLHDVYAVGIKRVEKPGKNRGYPEGVIIYVATPSKKDPNVLTEERITLRSTNEDNCQKWRCAIDSALKGLGGRPRKLRAFVNDWVNDGEATRVFYSKVVPVFQVAGTRLDVIVTTREGSAHQILQKVDFDDYDGLVCVGGEETTREVIHGLLERTQLDADLVEITPDTNLTKCEIPLGIIPVGLFNLVAHSSQGTSDPFTAAIHIILGHLHPLDVSAIFHNKEFIRFGFSMMYGFAGDCLRRAEQRAKGVINARGLDYAVAKSVFKVRTYRCAVEYLPCESNGVFSERSPCRTGCERCKVKHPSNGEADREVSWPLTAGQRADDMASGCDNDTGHDRNGQVNRGCQDIETSPIRTKADGTDKTQEWISVKGDFVSVGAMTLPNLCNWCPGGISPLTHLADGCLDLVLVRGTTRGEFVQHLRRHASDKNQFDFPFVSVHRARAVRFHPLGANDKPCTTIFDKGQGEGDTTCGEEASLEDDNGGAVPRTGKEFSMWNVDMELMASVPMEIRVHKQLLTVFASGIQDTDHSARSCRCL